MRTASTDEKQENALHEQTCVCAKNMENYKLENANRWFAEKNLERTTENAHICQKQIEIQNYHVIYTICQCAAYPYPFGHKPLDRLKEI
jgi:hypothetical protein